MSSIAYLFRYFALLHNGKIVLWCYLIWYGSVVTHHFDPKPEIWLNSLGISVVIGFALLLSVGGSILRKQERWQTIRLFLMPFCVSSFSALIKGKGFFLIFPPTGYELFTAIGSCAAFTLVVACIKALASKRTVKAVVVERPR